MSGSVTRLERYQQCPFKFYAQYGLKLEPRRVRSFGAPEIGTFLHANLERLGNYLLDNNKQSVKLTALMNIHEMVKLMAWLLTISRAVPT